MSGGTAADYSSLHGPWETLIESLRMQEPPRGLPPFCFLLALLVGLTLPRADLVEGTPFGLHPHAGVARGHGARDVPGDAYDRLVASARFRGGAGSELSAPRSVGN